MILVIYGAASGGFEVFRIAEAMKTNGTGFWDKVVYVDDFVEEIRGEKVFKIGEVISEFGKENIEVSISIGEPAVREKIYNSLNEQGIGFANVIHPTAYIDDTTEIGSGVTVFENSYFGPFNKICDNTFFMHKAIIGHDALIGRHSVIGSNCNVAGHAIIGERVFSGFLSGIRDNTMVGNDVIISPGAIIFHDVPDSVIMVGNPARVSKKNDEKRVFKNK